MKISGTVLICVLAVVVVGLAMICAGHFSCGGGVSGFAETYEKPMAVKGVVENTGSTLGGRPQVTLTLCGERFAGEKTVVYMRDTAYWDGVRPGDTLVAEVKAKLVENFTEEFDYVEYMAGKGVFFVCFQRGVWSVVPVEEPEFRYRVRRARSRCIAALRRFFLPLKKENSVLLVAFLAGDKEDISDELLVDFRRSGLMHTLALSGLHVGIIYGILSFIFSILGNYPASRKFRSVVIILCLWPYAALTGMGTSIFRAVVMATVYEMAVIFGRERSPVSALAISAVVVTFADPSAPSSVSFQLSFGAMLGISLFYRTLSGLLPGNESSDAAALRAMSESESLPPGRGIPGGDWLGKSGGRGADPRPGEHSGTFRCFRRRVVAGCGKVLSRWLRKLWNLCALSLSCQIITMPIVYGVFGTFAEWSLLANVICSPLVGIAMTMAPVCVVIRDIPWAGDTAFLLLDRVLDALRFCVEVMAS